VQGGAPRSAWKAVLLLKDVGVGLPPTINPRKIRERLTTTGEERKGSTGKRGMRSQQKNEGKIRSLWNGETGKLGT